MSRPLLLVTMPLEAAARAIVAGRAGDLADIAYLSDAATAERAGLLARAHVILARNTANELQPGEEPLIAGARLLQFMTAGIDYIPLKAMPAQLPIAANGGAYAEPMAEHAVAMAFAAAKRLLPEHRKLMRGEFDQFRPNRMLAGSVCAILGFGGTGIATARRMRALGLKVHAINRRGATAEPVDWIGTPDKLDRLLAAADVLVVAAPLSLATQGLIGARELGLMKADAILVNLARGEIIEEAALYHHLVANPAFTACIDAWWTEPVRHGRFAMGHPFLDLSNVVGSPHNSAAIAGARDMALRHALDNCRRVLLGEPALSLIGPGDRML
jgi:phosphoglycerate dehydrogenase-like enzyme